MGWHAKAALAALALAGVPLVHAEGLPTSGLPRAPFTPADPPVTPYSRGDGTYRLTLYMRYVERVSGRLELRHDQYFPDDNLKSLRQRNSIVWSVSWRF